MAPRPSPPPPPPPPVSAAAKTLTQPEPRKRKRKLASVPNLFLEELKRRNTKTKIDLERVCELHLKIRKLFNALCEKQQHNREDLKIRLQEILQCEDEAEICGSSEDSLRIFFAFNLCLTNDSGGISCEGVACCSGCDQINFKF